MGSVGLSVGRRAKTRHKPLQRAKRAYRAITRAHTAPRKFRTLAPGTPPGTLPRTPTPGEYINGGLSIARGAVSEQAGEGRGLIALLIIYLLKSKTLRYALLSTHLI